MFGRLPQNSKMKKHLFTLLVPMAFQNVLHIGLLKIIEMHMEFLHVMEFYLIMKVL